MDIKPIETRYRGYRFRSRLEARWAVFFDNLGLKWEYEKEGYDLGNLGYYLPDFWVENLHDRFGRRGMFVEIKGHQATDLEIEKLARLLKPGEHAAMLDEGMKPFGPYGDENEFLEVSWHNGGVGIDLPMVFMKCYSCGAVKYEFAEQNYCVCELCGSPADNDHPAIIRAYEKALSARFEFGECG
jgi:hypothetical protein